MSKSGREQNRSERAAAIQAAQARAERTRRLAIIGGAVVVLAVIAAALFWYSSSSGDTGSSTTSTAGVRLTAGDHALVMGKDSAAHKVVVYEDFLCPFCREFELSSRDFLRADAAKGLVQVEYRPFHLLPDDYSVRALLAFSSVLAESPAKALAFHNLLYDKQPYENAATKPDAAELGSWAASVGADGSAVRTAVEQGDAAWVKAADANAAAHRVTGTPTVLLDGKPLSGTSVTAMADDLEKLLAR